MSRRTLRNTVFALAALAAVGLTARPSLAVAQDGTAKKLDDPTIVAIFDAANTADIETGELAAKRATNADVRALGRQMANDHRAVNQKAHDLAKRLGVTPTPPADTSSAAQHHQVMKQLRAASGSTFDCTYLEHEVAFHKAVLDAVSQTLMPAITNAELKSFVQQVGPAFQGHMMAAENLAKKHNCSAGASGTGGTH